jgi:hypothetical protein
VSGPYRHARLVSRARGIVETSAVARCPYPGHATVIAGEDPRDEVRPDESRGVATLVERAATSDARDNGDLANTSRLLADRLIAGLDARSFRPTADQLATVWGGDLVRGETRASRARIAAGRYAALFTDHVIGDVTVDGGAGAYVRIWLCARLAFIESATPDPSEALSDGPLGVWENEGGAAP